MPRDRIPLKFSLGLPVLMWMQEYLFSQTTGVQSGDTKPRAYKANFEINTLCHLFQRKGKKL